MQLLTPVPLQLEGSARSYTHLLFRFPGKLHPPLVRELLKRHPDAKRVTDPMAGCGTVAVEAVAAGREGLFGDIDPLSCLITQVKVSGVDLEQLETAFEATLRSAQRALAGGKEKRPKVWVKRLHETTPYRAPPNVYHWFTRPVVAELASVLLAIHRRRNSWPPDVLDAMRAIVASSIRSLSRADPMPVSCIGVTKVRKKQLDRGVDFDTWKILRRKHDGLQRGLAEIHEGHAGTARVLQADARTWGKICRDEGFQADLAITSPPYCHAIEYWRRHALEYSWLGLIDTSSRSAKTTHHTRFIGTKIPIAGRSDELLPKPVEQTLAKIRSAPQGAKAELLLRQYFCDLRTWFRQYNEVLAPGGTLYAVLGPSTIRGVTVATPQLAGHVAVQAGLIWKNDTSHAYTNTVMQYPTSHGKRVATETVLCLGPGPRKLT